jgi:hypothetical protein
MPSSSYAPLADEVNPPFSKSTPAPIVTRSGTITYRQEDERDLGEMPRFSRYDKGKGKERAWDVEQGQERIQETQSYPPISSEEEDERRIQAVSQLLEIQCTDDRTSRAWPLVIKQKERYDRQSCFHVQHRYGPTLLIMAGATERCVFAE